MSTTTATSAYRTIPVTVSAGRQVRATNGAFLGEVADMERLGWTFATTVAPTEQTALPGMSTSPADDADQLTIFDTLAAL